MTAQLAIHVLTCPGSLRSQVAATDRAIDLLSCDARDQAVAVGLKSNIDVELVSAHQSTSSVQKWDFTAAVSAVFCAQQFEGSTAAALVNGAFTLLEKPQPAVSLPGIEALHHTKLDGSQRSLCSNAHEKKAWFLGRLVTRQGRVVVERVIVLEHRQLVGAWTNAEAVGRLHLPLTAGERTVLRGRRRSRCGRELLLQLPRDGALQPGDLLLDGLRSLQVEVIASPERLLRVRAAAPLELLQAAYHLGNRHVPLELHEQELLLLEDSVLAVMLTSRGLQVSACERPFVPDGGAYGGVHSHPHGLASA